ncbi:excinuclease ABC subunit C [Dysgonomonas sp. PFB1-18]|uniref:excinuclease ABC subunit UvrC n=1 Tax=unclassified Dysgonomonas TaxID=2630389 RepID=UPI0024756DFC|nr:MULTISPECIES: excinuclease ABC subunit UvrC [unclassified Dysgonomonas]MDH6310350.1 excinuclease ABC subunit C [Dysgonomonas sp. PF1-14]MDH6340320.1 excinuclease ABC subunit C [Dysgonomonas sp. PF1-16]MDH6381900.1 excinuclease ABC subunit C [Dysgonomonas sp. PFB1-18]MDH6399291.1 excinuclease ABC subunit C [Dysgonomonas sp. PF1-23]
MSEYLRNIIQNIPEKPGCYQYFDEKGVIIYVGKAKNLKKRVSSYFSKKHEDSPKTRILVSKIRDIKYIIVETESDTLLLENSLIKEFQPRYNVMLKDDKTYPSIVIRNEFYPRVELTRKIMKDGSLYFGPYSNVPSVKTLLEFIHKLYPIRTCALNLTPEKIAEGKYKVCLEYHIKRCLGPCIGLQTYDNYNKNIESIKEILKGNTNVVSDEIYARMQEEAEKHEFEEANKLKEKYLLVENFKNKSTVVSSIKYNIDVYSYDEDESAAYINYLNVHNGAIIQAYTFEYRKRLDEAKEELLGLGILEVRERFGSKAKEIVVPFLPDITLDDVEYVIPQRGDKKKLLLLSTQNVRQYKFDKLKKAESLNPEQRSVRILKEIQRDLNLKDLPTHIECFDNSNIQGTNPVSACVVFKMGKPSKRDYRHFNVKTVVGPDDFSTMREVVYRRYHRLLEEETPLPQLIVIDGGKGQLSAACESLKALGIYGKVAIVGIAKRLEEIYYPEDSIPLYLDKNSESLKVLQHLRDEAHRFGITFHRNQRSKHQIKSELDNIKGIGDEAKRLLFKEFRSVKRIKAAEDKELHKIIGKHKTALIRKYFEDKNA